MKKLNLNFSGLNLVNNYVVEDLLSPSISGTTAELGAGPGRGYGEVY